MKNSTVIFNGISTRKVYKPSAEPLGKAELLGEETFRYTVEVDMDAIHGMAHRAAGNANGKAVRGPVRVKVTSRDEIK